MTVMPKAFKADDLYQARKFLERSLSIDPAFARAYAALSFNYATAWALHHDSDYLNPHTLEQRTNWPRVHCR